LYGHDASSLPIGKGVSARVEKDRLIIAVRFAPTTMGQRVEQLIAGDHGLRSVSVGFVPKTWSMSKDKDRLHGIDYHTHRLLELSVVPVPANENAVLQRGLGTQEDRQASLDEVMSRQRQLDAQVAVEAKAKQGRLAKAKRFKEEAESEREWQERQRNTTREERQRERYSALRRVLGSDEAAIIEQRARDRGRA
jgi:HK97 family phage prohead protease